MPVTYAWTYGARGPWPDDAIYGADLRSLLDDDAVGRLLSDYLANENNRAAVFSPRHTVFPILVADAEGYWSWAALGLILQPTSTGIEATTRADFNDPSEAISIEYFSRTQGANNAAHAAPRESLGTVTLRGGDGENQRLLDWRTMKVAVDKNFGPLDPGGKRA